MGQGLRLLHVDHDVIGIVGVLFDLAVVLYCSRVFRGRGETRDSARRLGQMTATARSSRGLGVLFAVIAGFGILGFLFLELIGRARVDVVGDVAGLVLWLALAVLYLRSGALLRSREAGDPHPDAADSPPPAKGLATP
ncbi:hypothetical protein GCM10025780_13110 [Frondihabitans cladoniiphilus]|uniref:Uncharacterized protein n=1 Tax=Frondihabitans cladoniiphilus TaxID=715785 RepID=A0ABP8VV48_9MICO